MKELNICPIEEKYLSVIEILSIDRISTSKELCLDIHKKRSLTMQHEDKNLLEKYLNYKKQDNEIVFSTSYAYENLIIPTQFNCFFNIINPRQFIKTKFIITQSIFEGIYPIKTIEKGHKHILIGNFTNNTINNTITELVFKSKISLDSPPNQLKIGICNYINYPFIKDKLNK